MATPKLSPLILLLSKRIPTHCFFSSSTPQNYHPAIATLKQSLNPTTLIHLLNSDPDPISALHLFQWASRQKHFKHTPTTYAYLISKLGLARKPEEMEQFLKEMVKLQHPDAEFSFQFLVESFVKHHRSKEALKVFEIAVSAKIRMPILTCNVLLSSLVDLHSVVFVYKEMVKAGVWPNVDTLNCLIKVLVENGEMGLALEQFRRMEKKKCRPNSWTFEVLIGGLCSSGRVDEAVGVFDKMLEDGCRREHGFYMGVVPLFCRVGRLDEAVKLWGLMKGDGFLPDLCLCSVLIECLCANLRVDDAVKVFDEMGERGVAPVTCMYVDIVTAYCKLEKFSEAMSFLEENDVPETEPYNVLLQGLCDEGKSREAASYLRKIQEMGKSDGDSWNILINCLCKEGSIRKAFEIVGRMIVSACSPDGATHSSILTGYCKLCSYDRALGWLRQDFVKNMSLDSDSCSELIEGLCQMEKVEEAVEVFYYIIDRKGGALSTKALDKLVRGLCFLGKLNNAIKLRSVASSNGAACSPSIYEILILGLLDLNQGKDKLLLVLSQMLMEGCAIDSRTYQLLVCSLCVDSPSSAARLFNRMVHDGFIPDPETLEKLVYSASKYSWLHLVVHSLDKVVEGGGLENPTVCNMLIYGLLKEGRKQEARKFLDWMLDKGWVPNSDTHGLLVGNVDVEGREETSEVHEDGDGVNSILSEGLGNSR